MLKHTVLHILLAGTNVNGNEKRPPCHDDRSTWYQRDEILLGSLTLTVSDWHVDQGSQAALQNSIQLMGYFLQTLQLEY